MPNKGAARAFGVRGSEAPMNPLDFGIAPIAIYSIMAAITLAGTMVLAFSAFDKEGD